MSAVAIQTETLCPESLFIVGLQSVFGTAEELCHRSAGRCINVMLDATAIASTYTTIYEQRAEVIMHRFRYRDCTVPHRHGWSGLGASGRVSVHARSLSDDVSVASMDDANVCRFWNG